MPKVTVTRNLKGGWDVRGKSPTTLGYHAVNNDFLAEIRDVLVHHAPKCRMCDRIALWRYEDKSPGYPTTLLFCDHHKEKHSYPCTPLPTSSSLRNILSAIAACLAP